MSLATLGARDRSKPRPRGLPRWITVVGVVLVLATVLVLFAVRYLEVFRLNQEAARLASLKRTLQQQNAVLREEMKLLNTPGYVEKVAREQLGLVRPGEVAVHIVRPPAPPPSPPTLQQDRVSLLGRIIRAAWRVLSR